MYVLEKVEDGDGWEVGHYAPDGSFHLLASISDLGDATYVVNYLNGGNGTCLPISLVDALRG